MAGAKTVIYWTICLSLLPQLLTASTILVTGGAGFIGSRLSKKLLDQSHKVIIIDNLNNQYYNSQIKKTALEFLCNHPRYKNLTFYQIDLKDKTALEEIIASEKPTIICHLAACGSVKASIDHPEWALDDDMMSIFNLLECARKYPVKNFIFASSCSVYGDKANMPFREGDLTDLPCSAYGVGKRSGEMMVYAYHHLHKIPSICLRFFNVYGPNARRDMAPFQFLDALMNNRPINLYGNVVRDLVYIDDVVACVIHAIDNPQPFNIINVGTGETTSMLGLIKCFEYLTDKVAIIKHHKALTADAKQACADVTKLKSFFPQASITSLDHGLRSMVTWYKSINTM